MGILACELEARCQTQRQRSLSLLASFHVCFVSSNADIMHTVLMPLHFTRFPLNSVHKKKFATEPVLKLPHPRLFPLSLCE